MKPRLLDLFCGAGGAAMGYHRAGFEVVGVDVEPQPHYPFKFVCMDALEYPLGGYDAIHASPPCQGYTSMGNRYAETKSLHPKLIEQTRERLVASGAPYVIENVVGASAAMRTTLLLDGSMFGLGVNTKSGWCGLHRPRLFESNVLLFAPARGRNGHGSIGVYGDKPDGRRLNTRKDGTEQRAAASLEEAQAAMGMPWGDWHGVKEAIPPAYTRWIGEQLIAALEVAA